MSASTPVARQFNHIAFPTDRLEETCRFYTQTLGLPLVGAVQADEDDAPGQPPHIHVFFATTGGGCIAFFHIPGVTPDPNRDGVPPWSRHFAFGVDSAEAVHEWKAHLTGCGVPTSEIIDHNSIWSSVYFTDPNGILLEFTYQSRALASADATKATALVTAWTALHPDARA